MYTYIYIYIYVNFSLFTGTDLCPFFFSLFVLSPSYSIWFFLSIFLLFLWIHHKPFWVSCPFFPHFPRLPCIFLKNPERLKNKNDWPQRCATKTYRDSNSLHCKMGLSGPYLSRALARVLRNLIPWHTYFFVLPAPIIFFPIYVFSNVWWCNLMASLKNQSSFERYKHKQTPHFADVLNNVGKQEHWIWFPAPTRVGDSCLRSSFVSFPSS